MPSSSPKSEITTWYAIQSVKYGREYYFNPETNESTWILPDDDHPNPNECVYNIGECQSIDPEPVHHWKEEGKQEATATIPPSNDVVWTTGRCVGLLLCLLALCAILFTLPLKEDMSQIEKEAIVESVNGRKEEHTIHIDKEDKGNDEVGIVGDLPPKTVEEGQPEAGDIVLDEREKVAEEAINRKPAEMQEREAEGYHSASDEEDSTAKRREEIVAGQLQDGETQEDPNTNNIQEINVVDVTAKTEDTKSKDSSGETAILTEKDTDIHGSASSRIEPDWGAIREAAQIPLAPQNTSFQPTRVGEELLQWLEEHLAEAGLEIEKGPDSITLREKGSKSKQKLDRPCLVPFGHLISKHCRQRPKFDAEQFVQGMLQ